MNFLVRAMDVLICLSSHSILQTPLGVVNLAACSKCVKTEDVAGHSVCFSIVPRLEGDRIYNISATRYVRRVGTQLGSLGPKPDLVLEAIGL